MFNCLSAETDVEKPISHRWTQINTDGFIRVVLKTPVSILSRDGNGAGAPEKEASNAFAARKRIPRL
jgi:hypothetical protein